MLQVAIFDADSSYSLTSTVNKFLIRNENFEIKDIKFTCRSEEGEYGITKGKFYAMVIYEKSDSR